MSLLKQADPASDIMIDVKLLHQSQEVWFKKADCLIVLCFVGVLQFLSEFLVRSTQFLIALRIDDGILPIQRITHGPA